MAEIEKPDTPTNVVDDIPDNIQKLIDEGKVIKTKTSSGAFRLANQDTLVIDKSNVTSKEYKELKNFADEFEYMLIKPYKADNQTSGVKTNNFDVMKNEYFNYNTTEIEKLYSDDYYLATYTPHQDQVKDLLKDIYDEYSQYFDKRFELEMYPYKGTEFTDGKSVMLLKKIYIKPEFQGQGIGSEIINKITKFADELNIPIMLSTDPGQKLAETLPDYYARFGFLDTGDVEAHTGNRERWLIRQPGELAGKIVEYGEVADDFKTYEEALQAARNTDKPLYSDYIIKQITDRGQTVPGLDTPTNVVDDFKLSGTMGGNTTPTGVNIAYAKVEDLEQFIQFDRKAEGNVERINEIKKTILDKGYLYDNAYEGGVVFGVIIDEAGNVQIPEGNHRLQALIDVAKETGQEIYVPINPMLTSTGGGNKVQLTNSDNAYNSMKQLLTDMLEGNKNFNVERTISEKLGEPGTRIIGLESYTYPGGAPGTSTTQSNIKKFFNSIGLNTITYDELPDNNIYKTGVNTFTDTPTNVVDEVIEIAIPGSLIDMSSDPGAKLLEISQMLNEDYPNIDMIEIANNLETRIVKKGKGYQQIYTISTKQEKELLDYFIGDLIGFAEEYYNDPLIPSEKARAKRAFEAGYKLQEELKNFNPTDTSGVSLGAAKLNDPLVFDSWIDNLGKTTTSFVDNLPLETIVKNRVKNLIGKKSAQAATPGGLMDAVDVWEFSVLGLMAAAVAFKEYDEIPTIITNKAVDMFNSMTSFYGIPPVQKKEYDLDYEYITKVLDTGEKFMPTDIIIKKGVEEFKEGQESGVDISAGLGAQAGVFNNSITTPAKTDTMETTQKIQPGVQEEKMFEQARLKKNRSGGSGGGSGVKIL